MRCARSPRKTWKPQYSVIWRHARRGLRKMSDDPGNPDAQCRTRGRPAATLRRNALRVAEARPEGARPDLPHVWNWKSPDCKGPGGRDAEADPVRARRSEAADRERSNTGGRWRAAECARGDSPMNADVPDEPHLQRALADAPKMRLCLRCATAFPSEGFGERICKRCKGSHGWKNAADFHHATPRKT